MADIEQTQDKNDAKVETTPSSDIDQGTSTAIHDGNVLSRALRRLTVQPQSSTFAPGRWSNADLDPTPPSQQTWTTLNYIFYWTNDALGPGNLRLGASLYTTGLSWKLVLVVIALGHFLMAVGLTLNGRVGARFHIPYTIQARASFGFFFAFVVVVVRMVVSAFWYGINTATGASCVKVILVAIWPSFANLKNGLPAGANITTQTMVAYVLYFLLVLPFHWIHPRKLRWFFAVKSLVVFPAVLGMLIWACVATGNGTDNEVFKRGNTLQGAELGWAFMSGLNAMMANYGTLAVNINDFTRYAKKDKQTYAQLFIIPFSFMMMAFVGLVIVGSAERVYGELQWDVLSIMGNWSNTSGGRAAAVFAGAAMAFGQMGVNLGANCVSAANDLNAMFPKYINLRRGSILIAFLGAWALTPWNILSSAEALLNFMDGYSIWLAPITGVMLADFYLVHRQVYDVRELYDVHGRYRYNRWGTNWRAAVAWCIGWAPLVPGLANAVSTATVSAGALHLYDLGYCYGLASAFVVYVGLSVAFPPRKTMAYEEEAAEM